MTLQAFLRTVQAKVGGIDRGGAERATAAVFHALRDRLTPVEGDQLAAQLPAPLKRIWHAGEIPGREPARVRRDAFYRRVGAEAGTRTRREAQELTLGVFAALKEAISPGEADDVWAQLPKDLFLNEAALTGESLPVEKHAERPGGSDEALTAATPAVFHGASVVSGRGIALVVHTGSRPRRWNVAFIRRYMLVLGPVSSVFDFATFAVMLGLFRAGPELFRTGWFVDSLATQTLVIFVIRTAGRPWASRPSGALAGNVAAVVAVGALLPFTPVAPWLGFTPLPPSSSRC